MPKQIVSDSVHSCKLLARHPQVSVSKEVLELKALIKDSEKKEGKARNDLELLRVRAKSSFQFCFVLFGAVQRLRLCTTKQNKIDQ